MASIREYRGKYQVRYRVAGRMRSKAFPRLTDARRFANSVETDLARGDYIDPRAGLVSFGDYADRWIDLRQNLSRSTIDRDRSYLSSMILPAFGSHPIGSILPSDVESWLSRLDRAPATAGKALGIVRSVFEVARRDQAIRSNPARDVKPPRQSRAPVGRALTDGEVEKILEAADEQDRLSGGLVWLMARAGLRIGEALALRRRDIDFSSGFIHVERSMSRSEGPRPVKGRTSEAEGRVVPMPPDLADRLREHLSETSSVVSLDGLVFTTLTGLPIEYHNWRKRRWLPLVDRAKVGDVRPHDLRHTAATRLFVVDRWTPAEVQAFLGHRDPRITLQVYTHIHAESLPIPSRLGVPS